MIDSETKNYRKVAGLPLHLMVDNDNHLSIEAIDRDWYIRQARRYVNDFLGKKAKNSAAVTRKIHRLQQKILALFDDTPKEQYSLL